eukprot:5876012-Pyramimonas_sp.AAC.1
MLVLSVSSSPVGVVIDAIMSFRLEDFTLAIILRPLNWQTMSSNLALSRARLMVRSCLKICLLNVA